MRPFSADKDVSKSETSTVTTREFMKGGVRVIQTVETRPDGTKSVTDLHMLADLLEPLSESPSNRKG